MRLMKYGNLKLKKIELGLTLMSDGQEHHGTKHGDTDRNLFSITKLYSKESQTKHPQLVLLQINMVE